MVPKVFEPVKFDGMSFSLVDMHDIMYIFRAAQGVSFHWQLFALYSSCMQASHCDAICCVHFFKIDLLTRLLWLYFVQYASQPLKPT